MGKIISLEDIKDYKFYRIATDIKGKIFLEFKNSWHYSIFLKHSIIKNKGISFYYDTTLYDIFKFNNELEKYIIKIIK